MSQVIHWFAMGGYAGYVWSAYGLVLAVFAINLACVKWQRMRTRKKLQLWFRQK